MELVQIYLKFETFQLFSLYFFCFYFKKIPSWIWIQEGK